MKKKTKLQCAIEWIAFNDEPGETCFKTLKDQVSVVLIADVFGVPQEDIARKVMGIRARDLS